MVAASSSRNCRIWALSLEILWAFQMCIGMVCHPVEPYGQRLFRTALAWYRARAKKSQPAFKCVKCYGGAANNGGQLKIYMTRSDSKWQAKVTRSDSKWHEVTRSGRPKWHEVTRSDSKISMWIASLYWSPHERCSFPYTFHQRRRGRKAKGIL